MEPPTTEEKEFILTSEEASSKFDPNSLLYQEEGMISTEVLDTPQSVENLSNISANGDSFICLDFGETHEILGSLEELSFSTSIKKDKLSLSCKVSIQTISMFPSIKGLPLVKFKVFIGGNEQIFPFENFLLKKIKYYQLGQSTALCRMVLEHYL